MHILLVSDEIIFTTIIRSVVSFDILPNHCQIFMAAWSALSAVRIDCIFSFWEEMEIKPDDMFYSLPRLVTSATKNFKSW